MAKRVNYRKLDALIEDIYRRRCSGIEIDIMDISKIFEAGRTAYLGGGDVEAAVISTTQRLRKN